MLFSSPVDRHLWRRAWGEFAALGTDPALDAHEQEPRRHCEVKLRGRLKHDGHDLKELNVPNMITRICPGGLLDEPDPRHVEMLAAALGDSLVLGDVSAPATPWQKSMTEDIPVELSEDHGQLEDTIATIQAAIPCRSLMSFRDVIEELPVPSWHRPISKRFLLSWPVGSLPLVCGSLKHIAYSQHTARRACAKEQ